MEQVRSLTGKNGLGLWCQVIVTHERTQWARGNALRTLLGRLRRTRPGLCVRINAFMYTDPQNVVKKRAQVRLLPGTSPLRAAALLAERLGTIDLCAGSFPLEQILLDRPDSVSPSRDQVRVPDALATELDRLPAEAREKAELRSGGGSFTVVVPLPCGDVAYLAVHQHRTRCVSTALIEERATGEVRDASAILADAGSDVTLSEAYSILARVVPEAHDDATDTALMIDTEVLCPRDEVAKLCEDDLPSPPLVAEANQGPTSELSVSGGSKHRYRRPEC
ncbi:hypothetical protein ACFL09_01010 [Planctomycetota bacterium]